MRIHVDSPGVAWEEDDGLCPHSPLWDAGVVDGRRVSVSQSSSRGSTQRLTCFQVCSEYIMHCVFEEPTCTVTCADPPHQRERLPGGADKGLSSQYDTKTSFARGAKGNFYFRGVTYGKIKNNFCVLTLGTRCAQEHKGQGHQHKTTATHTHTRTHVHTPASREVRHS